MTKYTTPKLNKGKEPVAIPKGSNKAKEWAKNDWYISYTFDGKQVKVKGGLNRIHNHLEKQLEADSLLLSIKNDLANGFNPFSPAEYLSKVEKLNISLKDGIAKFTEYHSQHYTKPKTIQSYRSKLNALLLVYPNAALSDIKLSDLESFVKARINDKTYSQNTVKFAKRTFSAFFAVMVKLGYISSSPYLGFNSMIKSVKRVEDSHLPYSNEQLKAVMEWLDENDNYGATFCRFIYHTCIRPGEIRQLKVRDINMKNKTIIIRAENKKVTGTNPVDDVLDILPSFLPTLEKMQLENQNPNDFILGSTRSFFSNTPVGINTPYQRIQKALKALKLDKQGYDLYSFKHTSNINKFNEGWLPNQIQKANRHSSIQQTLTYLKKINHNTDLKGMDLKAI